MVVERTVLTDANRHVSHGDERSRQADRCLLGRLDLSGEDVVLAALLDLVR